MFNVEQSMERELAGETEVPGENLPQCHFVQHEIPHEQTWARTRAVAGGTRLLTV
jgi:hypothetical protein